MNMKRILALFLAVLTVLSAFALPIFAEGETSAQPQWPEEGAIALDKSAGKYDGAGENEHEITLKIEGKNFKATSDVVLVIDNSNSLYDDDKMTDTKTAAYAFVDKLLTAGSTTRIALVVYGTDVRSFTKFYGADEAAQLKTAIGQISKEEENLKGGTNQQAGIHKAQELLSSAASTGRMKNIVIMSDGEATFSYPFVAEVTYNDCGRLTSAGCEYFGPSGGSTSAPGTFSPDYSTYIGEGNDFNLKYNAYVDVKCSKHSTVTRQTYGVYALDGTVTERQNTNNGVATIWEANQAKAAGTTVYSVALQAGTNGENVLKACATDAVKGYFAIASGEQNVAGKLTSAFEAIAGSIAIAASNGKVTDPMSDEVSLQFTGASPAVTSDLAAYNAKQADIYISQGTAAWDDTTKTISWDVGNINEGSPAIMKYRIRVTGENLETGDTVPTNKRTIFSYRNYQEEQTEKDFPVPKVTVGGGTILMHFYRVNVQGKPVNAAGVEVETPDKAQQLAEPAYYEVDGKNGLPYGTYTVAHREIENAAYYGFVDGAAPDIMKRDPAAPVTLTATKPAAELWFAYTQSFTVVHVQNGQNVRTETLPVTEDAFDITAHVSTGYLYGGTFRENHETVADFHGGTPMAFQPQAGDTYYIWEVPETYLRPKTYRVWRPVPDGSGNVSVVRLYLLTTVDRGLYRELGFTADGTDNVAEGDGSNIAYRVVNVTKGSEPYGKLYVQDLQGNMTDNLSGAPAENSGYVGVYPLTASQFASFRESGTTFCPYWITLDGVKVTGTVTRTAGYQGAGPKDSTSPDYKKITVSDAAHTSALTPVGTASGTALLSLAPSLTLAEDAETEQVVPTELETPDTALTVTIHDGETVTTLTAEPGDLTDRITYTGAEGKLFAGWFTDEACTAPADLTAVQESMELYARYVSDGYLQVKYMQRGLFRVRGVTLLTAVDGKTDLQVGFLVNGEPVAAETVGRTYGGSSARYLFDGVDRDARLAVGSADLQGAVYGDEITVTPYWITADGTTVYGTSRTLVYSRYGLKG